MKIAGTVRSIVVTLLQAQLEPDKEYLCEIKEKRNRRSLDANAYYWSLLHQYAEWSKRSDMYIHNDILSRFGQPQLEMGKQIAVAMLDDINWKDLSYIHLRPTSEAYMGEDLRMYRNFIVIRGSHEYDSAEFSRLIDGLIEEIVGSGAPIETMTPAELALLKGYAA